MRKLFTRMFSTSQKWLLNMRPRYFWFLTLILFAIIYFLSCLFPIHKLRPHVNNQDISLNEIFTRSFQLLAAIATFISAFVALFRDELRRIFLEEHKLSVNFEDNTKLIEEINFKFYN